MRLQAQQLQASQEQQMLMLQLRAFQEQEALKFHAQQAQSSQFHPATGQEPAAAVQQRHSSNLAYGRNTEMIESEVINDQGRSSDNDTRIGTQGGFGLVRRGFGQQSDGEIIEYIVCQTGRHGQRVLACLNKGKPGFGGAEFDFVILSAPAPLTQFLLGDIAFIRADDIRELASRYDDLSYQGRITARAEVPVVDSFRECETHSELAIITNSHSHKSGVFVVDIMSKHGKVSQRLTPDQGRDGIDINRLRAGNVVQAECFWLHQGSVANPTFFISSSASGFALKQAMVLADSVKIHESSYISYVKPYYPAPASLVIPVREIRL
jgi:hypothetical protein